MIPELLNQPRPFAGQPMTALVRLGLFAQAVEIARQHGVGLADAVGRSRRKGPAGARHRIWALLRDKGLSFPDIGAIWGVNHTTVLLALHKLEIESLVGDHVQWKVVKAMKRERGAARGAA